MSLLVKQIILPNLSNDNSDYWDKIFSVSILSSVLIVLTPIQKEYHVYGKPKNAMVLYETIIVSFEKYQVISIIRRRKIIKHIYLLHGQPMAQIDSKWYSKDRPDTS